jgi:hypothetical protein
MCSRTKRKMGWNQFITKLSIIWISPYFHSLCKCSELFYYLKKQINPLNDQTQHIDLMFSSLDVYLYSSTCFNHVVVVIGCKWDNTNHTCLLSNCYCDFFGEIFLEYFWNIFEIFLKMSSKKSLIFLWKNFILFY